VNIRPPSPSSWLRRTALACAGLLLAQGAAGHAAPPPEESAYFIRVWRTDDGLPPLISELLVEAPEGYLWVEAKEGPVRFDGEHVTPYSSAALGWPTDTRISSALGDGVQGIWVLLGDHSIWRERGGEWRRWAEFGREETPKLLQPAGGVEGGVYIGTNRGRLLRCVDAAPGARELLPADPTITQWFATPKVDDAVWFTRKDEAFRWTSGVSEHVSVIDRDPDPPRYLRWRDGSMWIVGQTNIWKMQDGAFRKLPPILERGSENMAGILPAPPHGIWGTTLTKIFFLPTGETRWRGPFPWASSAEFRMSHNLSDANGHHWLATFGFGFVHMSPEGQRIAEKLPPELAGNRILNLLEDRERNIWAVATGSGLVRLRARQFTVYRAGQGLSDPEVLAVAEDAAGALWAGSRAGGADVLKDGVWRHVSLPPRDVPEAAVTALLSQANGDLLVGTFARGVWRKSGESWTRLGQGNDQVRVLLADRSGHLWAGCRSGLLEWQGEAWRPVLAKLPWPVVRALAEDAQGRIWVATERGIWRRETDGEFRPIPATEGVPDGQSQSLLVRADGGIWIGTDRGLVFWHDGRARLFTRANGLPVTQVVGLLETGPDQLWLSSPDGLAALDVRAFQKSIPETVTGQAFTRADGLPTREASGGFQPALSQSANGHCWFPTHQGLVEFDPHTMPPPAPPPPVVIENATAAYQDHRTSLAIPPLRAAPAAFGPELPTRMRRLDFHFTAPSLSAPEKVLFRWRLEGLDTTWSEPSPQRSAVYPYVPPGAYRFRVLACNGDGVWNETGATVAFVIPPLWHERPIFWIAVALLVGGVALGSLRSRYLRRIERLRLLSALDHERARIAQDIHDDLGATLTQISMWSAIAQKRADPATAGQLGLIRERSNEAVRSLDQIVWAVNPGNDTVRKFATYVCQAVGDFFRETNVACRIDLAEMGEDGALHADVRHHLVLAAREACTNALRHSGATEVSLHVEAGPHRIFITITDNGCGFNPETVSKDGEGLSGMKRRLATIRGACTIESALGRGTRVVIQWEK